MNNELINELYNKLDAQEDIIKALEIQLAELKKKKCKSVLGDCLIEEIEELKGRIDKAIDYIENDLSHFTSNGIATRRYLVNILKGEE